MCSNALRIARIAVILAGAALTGVPASAAASAVVYGTTGTSLVRFSAATPGVIDETLHLQGLPGGVRIVALDERPATLGLYGLGSDGHVYRVGKSTGRTVAVTAEPVALDGDAFSLEADPVGDVLRMVSDRGQNVRVDPDDGTVTVDTPLAAEHRIAAIAHDRNVHGATASTLVAIDAATDRLRRIGGVDGMPSPSGGAVTDIGPLNADTTTTAGFDITPAGVAYAALTAPGASASILYRLDLARGFTFVDGRIGSGAPLLDVAVAEPPRIAYTFTGAAPGQLVRFPTDLPIAGAVVGAAALGSPPETPLGLDVRPATGELVAVTDAGRVHRVDRRSGAAAKIGGNLPTGLAVADAGVEVDPVADVIRVTDATGRNLRINPFSSPFWSLVDGLLAFAPGDLLAGATPAVVASAATNARPAAVSTTIYDVDHVRDVVLRRSPPNAGALTTLDALDVDVPERTAFDLEPSGDDGYLLTSAGGTVALVRTTVDELLPPAVRRSTAVGPVGTGSPLTGATGLALGAPGRVAVPGTLTVDEDEDTVEIPVTRTLGDDGTVNVAYRTRNVTAAGGVDYEPRSGVLTFEDGETTATIDVPVHEDDAVESTETFELVLDDPGGGVRLGHAVTTVRIVSDDVTPPDAPVAPGPGTSAPAPVVTTPPPDRSAPAVLLEVPGGRIRTVVARGLRAALRVAEPARAHVTAAVDTRTARRLRLRGTAVGSPVRTTLTPGVRRTVTLRLTPAARQKLRRTRTTSVRITVTAVVEDLAGNRTVRRERVTLRR